MVISMSETSQEQSEINKKITLVINNSEIEEEKTKKVNELINKITIKGFRKGHVSKDIFLSKFGEKIQNDIINNIINTNFLKIIEEKNLTVLGSPNLKISKTDTTFIVDIIFETYPDIKLNLESINVIEYISNINEADILYEKNKLKLIHGDWINSDLKISMYDIITADIYDITHGKRLQLLKNHDIFLTEDLIFFENFVKEIITYKKNDFIEINLLGKKIFNKHLVNVEKIKIYIQNIKKSMSLENDLQLCEKLKIKNNIENYIRLNLEKKIKIISNKIIKKNLILQLLEKNTFIVPQILLKSTELKYEKQKINRSMLEIEKEIKIELILNEIITKFNLKISKLEVSNALNNIKQYKNEKNLTKKIEDSLLEEKVFELLLSKINIQKETINYKELFILDY